MLSNKNQNTAEDKQLLILVGAGGGILLLILLVVLVGTLVRAGNHDSLISLAGVWRGYSPSPFAQP